MWLKGVMKIVSVPGGLGIRGRSFGLSPVSRRVVCIGIPQKQVKSLGFLFCFVWAVWIRADR